MQSKPLLKGRTLPVVPEISAAGDRSAAGALEWAHAHASQIDGLTGQAGVVLIRGFEIGTPEDFRGFCHAIRPDLRNYKGGDSPRTGLADQVYTSTEYPAHLEVLLHNELSYAGWSPERVFFGCLLPAQTGGETQIADGRQIYDALPPDIRARFEDRGITYLQHLWDAEGEAGIGKSWQETFETDDRRAVERYLVDSGMEFEWTSFGLRTRATHAAVLEHPVTGEKCWHNQADQWHRGFDSVKVSFGAKDDPRYDPETSGEATLGNHVVFGDGREIDTADLQCIRDTSRQCEVLFPWHAGDVMVVDNILAMHGRKPFTGPRRVIVAMA